MSLANDATVHPGGDPPVVFVSGMSETRDAWAPVLPLLTCNTTTVVYDRPGNGTAPRRTDTGPLPYSAFADELAALLDDLGLRRPAVLVGHSFGSVITRVFAVRHPARVAGMVHVDGSTPRLALWPGSSPLEDGGARVDNIAGEAEIRGAVFPPVPALVLARTPGNWYAPIPDPAVDDVWQQAQADLAKQLGCQLIVAENAGHALAREAPGLVAAAVDEVVRAVRGR